jgi:carbamoyl-phosphate synthase large subunit
MNLLFSCIGKRGYIADFFRPHLTQSDKIIGTSNTLWTPGFKHCDKNFILPSINDPKYIESVLDLCKKESITAVLSFFDPDVVELSKYFDEFLNNNVLPIIPKFEIADICFDKYKTYKFLRANNINTSETFLSFEEAVENIAKGNIKYPLFVKPRKGFGSAMTFRAKNEKELDVFFNFATDMIIQEELQGDAFDFDILNDLSGKTISVIPWKKFRSRLGETEHAQTFYDSNLLYFGERLGNTLNHIGPLDADLFQINGEISVLEINLRFGGGYPVSHLSGADFPKKIIKMIHGEKIEPDIGKYKNDVVMMKDNLIIGGQKEEFFRTIIDI